MTRVSSDAIVSVAAPPAVEAEPLSNPAGVKQRQHHQLHGARRYAGGNAEIHTVNEIHAMGGYANLLDTQAIPEVLGGEKHEEGGTFIGMGSNGKPNIAEKGEVKWGNFIFSDRF